jgi:nitroimidazol reductase NimA-like FMN-containing flavoprotein (pyridoxamine 5'-phosphate oxidase superfamily)
MSKAEIETFLMYGTRTRKISTVHKDGRPHLVPIWFVFDSKDINDTIIVFTTGKESVEDKDMLRDPRVCLCM